MGRPVKHNSTTREALLDKAEQLLSEHGRDGVSVRAVADAAKLSTRAVYTVFGSMPGLLGALAARGFNRLADLVNGLPVTSDPVADLARCGVGGMRRFALERPHLFRITFERVSPEITSQPEARAAMMASYQSLATRVDRALDARLLQPLASIEIVFAFHAFTTGLALNELSRQPPPVGANFWQFANDVDFESLWQTALSAFVNGLRV